MATAKTKRVSINDQVIAITQQTSKVRKSLDEKTAHDDCFIINVDGTGLQRLIQPEGRRFRWTIQEEQTL